MNTSIHIDLFANYPNPNSNSNSQKIENPNPIINSWVFWVHMSEKIFNDQNSA
jgi:hypothetical protein